MSWARDGAPLVAGLALVASLLGPPSVQACNLCLEDKIAATYDWQVAAAAARAHHTVVFTALGGRVPPAGPALERAIRRAVAGLAGVDPGTVRVSLAPPAVSFACAPEPAAITRRVAAANAALGARHLTLSIVRIGAPGATPALEAAAASRRH